MPYGFNENKGKFMLNNYLNRSAIGNAPDGVYCFNADKSKFNLTPYLNGTVTTAIPNGVYCFDDNGSKYDLSGFLFVNKIAKPTRTSATVTYSGSSVAAPISGYSSSTMTMSGDTSATNVGTYTTYISPKTGYVWSDGTTNTLTFTWQITPMKIAKPYLSTTSYDYSGSAFTPTIVNYNSARMTKSGTDSASAVGTYKIYISPKANYAWTDGSTSQVTLAWEVKRKKISKPYLSQTSYEYTGSYITPSIVGYDSSKMYRSGDTDGRSVGSYTTYFTPKDNYMWSDGTTSRIGLTWSIEEAKANLQLGTSYYFYGQSYYRWMCTETYGNYAVLTLCDNGFGQGSFPGYPNYQMSAGLDWSYADFRDSSRASGFWNDIGQFVSYSGANYGSGLYFLPTSKLNSYNMQALSSGNNQAWLGEKSGYGQAYTYGLSGLFLAMVENSFQYLPCINVDLSKIEVSGTTLYVK